MQQAIIKHLMTGQKVNKKAQIHKKKSSKGKVLIVEDSVMIAMYIESELSSHDYNVLDHQQYGENAVEIAKREKPDLVFMDIRLAGKMDGIETASIIKSHVDCCIIFLTGNKDLLVRDKRVNSIAPFAILTKPVDTIYLREIIKQFERECSKQ